MLIYTLISIFILWQSYACASGIKDAVLWSKKGTKAFNWNEHLIFVVERLIIGLILTVSFLYGQYSIFENFWYFFLIFPSMFLTFPFIHNGFYYYSRNLIDNKYPKKFLTNMAPHTTAKYPTGTFKARLLLFLVGIIIFIIQIILYIK